MHKIRNKAFRLLCCTLLLIGISGCQYQSMAPLEADDPLTSASATLVKGDLVGITVFNQPDLSSELNVATNGVIDMPLVGSVAAAGLTTDQLAAAIVERLQPDYLRDPKVAVQLLSNRPIYLLGEVNQPGSYPYTDELSVAKAVALAGGFTYRAATKRIIVARTAADGSVKEFRATVDTPIRSGDLIRVAERFF